MVGGRGLCSCLALVLSVGSSNLTRVPWVSLGPCSSRTSGEIKAQLDIVVLRRITRTTRDDYYIEQGQLISLLPPQRLTYVHGGLTHQRSEDRTARYFPLSTHMIVSVRGLGSIFLPSRFS